MSPVESREQSVFVLLQEVPSFPCAFKNANELQLAFFLVHIGHDLKLLQGEVLIQDKEVILALAH